MKTLKVLVIEDNERHLQAAKDFFATVSDVEVKFSEDLYQAATGNDYPNYDKLKDFDLILSDIYFPYRKDTEEYSSAEFPIGVGVWAYAMINDIPCILLTDQNHHDAPVDWICMLVEKAGLGRITIRDDDGPKMTLMEVFDVIPAFNPEKIKQWGKAWECFLKERERCLNWKSE